MENQNNKQDLIKSIIDKIPGKLFPNTNETSAKTIGTIGFAIGIAVLVFSFIPCLGAYAIYLAVPGIYVNLWAIRRNSKMSTLMTLGLIFSIIATLIGIYWCCAIASTANEMEKAFADLEKL